MGEEAKRRQGKGAKSCSSTKQLAKDKFRFQQAEYINVRQFAKFYFL